MMGNKSLMTKIENNKYITEKDLDCERQKPADVRTIGELNYQIFPEDEAINYNLNSNGELDKQFKQIETL